MDRFEGRSPLGQRSRFAAVLLSMGLIAVACSSTPATSAPSAGATTAPGTGTSAAPSGSSAGTGTIDTVKMAGAGPVLTLDVTKSGDLVSVDTIMLVEGALFRDDVNGKPQPELAQSATPSADGKTVTIKLKPNLKYSDGSAVTANDVKAAIDRQLSVNGKPGVNSIFLASVASTKVDDDTTVEISLKYPDPDLLQGLTARAVAINPADKVASDPDYFTHPVSAGPYVVATYTPNGPLTMKENPNFVNGPMVVKNVDIESIPDQTSKVLQITQGQLDFAWDIPIASKDTLPKEVRQFIVEVGGANTLYLNMDPAGKAGTKFADPRVRQAISLAIDRSAVAQKAFLGLVHPLTSFWYECADICPTGTLPNGGKQDVAAAKQLMTAAGVPASGISATMEVSSTRAGWKDAATLIAQQLEAINIHFTVNPVDEATWNGDTANNNFEAIFNGGASSPQVTMASWFGDGFSATHSGYVKIANHQATDDLITQMAQETDPVKRKAIYTQIQQIGAATMPYVPIVDRIALDAIRLPDGVLNVSQGTPGYIIFQTVAEQQAGKGAGS
jgi:peptide/nickel transport system substrate-binding protein